MRYLRDPSVLTLVAANALVLLIAYRLRMQPLGLLLIYVMQSAIICLSQIVRILAAQRFDPGVQFGERPQRGAAWFVAWFYGLIHLILGALLVATAFQNKVPLATPAVYALCAGAFAINQVFTLIRGMMMDAAGCPKLMTLVFLPGPRVLAMHLTMVFGLFLVSGGLGLVLVGGVKTLADVAMYVIEQEFLTRGPSPSSAR